MRGLSTFAPVTMLLCALLLGCAGPPDKELQQAAAALSEARAAGADQYAPREYAAAADTLRAARQAVERRDNREARSLAIAARARAQDAARIAAEQKRAAQAAAMSAIQALEAAIDEARQHVTAAAAPGASTTREQRLGLSETRRAIVVANVSLQKARTAYVNGDFGAARDATAGVADHLKAVRETKPANSPQAGRPRRP
jgi:hypothetical protein